MTTYDLAEVRDYTADLAARLTRCDNGEGMECASLDDALRHYAALCCEFRERVRHWGREIFAGRVAFDPEVERVWREQGQQLYSRAVALLGYGAKVEGACYLLEGQTVLRSALWDLHPLLNSWVTPKLAVGPAARMGANFSPEVVAEARRRLESLPPLPADWQPTDPAQQLRFRRFRKQNNS